MNDIERMRGGKEVVVLVHGLWMTGLAMWPMGLRLRARGFAVRIFRYRSCGVSFEENAARLAGFLRRAGEEAKGRVHVFGHSYGGLLTLKALNVDAGLAERVGRVVCCGSPLRGSLTARRLRETAVLRWTLGRNVRGGLFEQEALEFPAGVEALSVCGTRAVGPGRAVFGLPLPNDGVVRVEETRIGSLAAVAEVPHQHTCLLMSRRTAAVAAYFLRHGMVPEAAGEGVKARRWRGEGILGSA